MTCRHLRNMAVLHILLGVLCAIIFLDAIFFSNEDTPRSIYLIGCVGVFANFVLAGQKISDIRRGNYEN